MLGEGSFDFPLESPWEQMLNNSRSNHSIANGIEQAWSHLQINFQEVTDAAARDNNDLLVNQPVEQIGFRSNGTIPKSVTREITMEIESARSTCLGKMIINSLDNDDYERWSWEGWNKTGASFATSPPDGIGMIKDTEWPNISGATRSQLCITCWSILWKER